MLNKKEQIIMLWSNVIELQKKVIVLEEKNTDFEARIKELEEVIFTLKANVKEQKVQDMAAKKRKWLSGMPDETGGDN